ncbi:hypothetical protein FRC12_018444 [Ceratobasidium sp. 428]|nr:hypothetical protein FRC12_018444 [Ceratobasidium sp. 428]
MDERSAGGDLDLCVWVRESLDPDPYRVIDPLAETDYWAEVVAVLSPIAPRVRRLRIASDFYMARELQPILACMMRFCTTGTIEILEITPWHRGPRLTRPVYRTKPHHNWRPTADQLNSFLSAVRVLRLRDVSLPFNSSAYHGLVELVIQSTGDFRLPNGEELVQILLACPALRSLSLENTYPTSPIPPHIESISLKQLRCLELKCRSPECLASFLGVLQLGSQKPTVKLNICEEIEFVGHFRTFLERNTAVYALCVSPMDDKAWFPALRHGLSGLSILTLERCDLADPSLIQHFEAEGLSPFTPWACLHTLRLEQCIVRLDLLEYLAGSRYLKRLTLVECRVRNHDSEELTPVAILEIAPIFAHSQHLTISVESSGRD